MGDERVVRIPFKTLEEGLRRTSSRDIIDTSKGGSGPD